MINKCCKQREIDETTHGNSTTQQCFLRKEKIHIIFPYYTNTAFREIPLSLTEKYHLTEAIYHTDWSKMECLHSNAAGSWAGFIGVVWSPAALHCAARPHCHLPSWIPVSQAWSHSQPPALRLPGGSFPAVQRCLRFSVEVLTHTSHFAQAFSSQIAQAPVWDTLFPIPVPLLSFSLSKVSVLLFKMFLFVDKISLTRTVSPSTPWTTCLS